MSEWLLLGELKDICKYLQRINMIKRQVFLINCIPNIIVVGCRESKRRHQHNSVISRGGEHLLYSQDFLI